MTRISSKVLNLSEVLYSGRFKVPWHQRHYDWTAEEVGDLLEDLMDALTSETPCYFLGSIMLMESSGTELQRINDGQQRLITFSLLMAAFCRRFSSESPPDTWRETQALRALFDRPHNEISSLQDARDYQTRRIVPPKDDRLIFTQLISGHNIGSNGLLAAAWNKIDSFVASMERQTRDGFFDFLVRRVEVSVLTVPADVDANRVFETLNARGKSLSDVDLIRNHLYSCFQGADDAARRQTVHENLQRTLIVLSSKTRVSEYFRCYLQCCYGHLQKKRFYREFRKNMEQAIHEAESSEDAFRLIAGLGRLESIWLFQMISSGKPSQALKGRLPKILGKRDLAVLLRELQGYKVAHPLCFALLHRFISETSAARKKAIGAKVAISLRNLSSFIMRAVFLSSAFKPYRIEEPLANCAKAVFAAHDLESIDIMDSLEHCDMFDVVDDARFIRRMTNMEFRSRSGYGSRKALSYLFGINAQRDRGSDALQVHGCSVEHVLPQSEMHWRGWTGFDGENPGDWIHRTGNLIVVSRRENRGEIEYNAGWPAKRQALAKSPLLMARTVAEMYEEWTPDVIKRRSEELAKDAARIWAFQCKS